MLALSLSDKFCCFGIFVFVFVNENHTAAKDAVTAYYRKADLETIYEEREKKKTSPRT